jgi:hypothetical protein
MHNVLSLTSQGCCHCFRQVMSETCLAVNETCTWKISVTCEIHQHSTSACWNTLPLHATLCTHARLLMQARLSQPGFDHRYVCNRCNCDECSCHTRKTLPDDRRPAIFASMHTITFSEAVVSHAGPANCAEDAPGASTAVVTSLSQLAKKRVTGG